MTRKICYTLALFVGILPVAMPRAWAQDSAEKSAAEKSATEKSTTERGPSSIYPQQSEMTPPVELRRVSVPITLKLAADSRAVYEAIGKQAGISVLFDPDYTPRPMSVDLNDVSLQDALKIVAFEAKTFWRPVTSSSIFIAADNPAKRRDLEQQVIKTFYLPNLTQPTDFQDIVNTMRAILQIDRVIMFTSHNTIVVRGTPDQIALTEKLIDDFDKAKKKLGEYRVEFKISELEGEKKLNSRIYSLRVEPHVTGRLRAGSRVPVQSAGASPEKGAEFQYLDVGQNIDCTVGSESEHTVGLSISVEISNVTPREKAGSDNAAPYIQGQPIIQQVKTEARATVELGKPTIIISSDDPSSNHTFQIEVTATRVRENE